MINRVTLKDVAKRSGVSYQTVSKVIHNQIQVTPQVRARIETAIKELGYRPNAAAQNLRTQSSHLIGYSWKLDSQNQSSPILEQFQHSLVENAEDFGYHILLFPHQPDRGLHATYEELVRARRVDGFILSSVEYNDPRIPSLISLNVPFVSFGRSSEDSPTSYVDVDNRAGIAIVVRHLIEEGHQRIAVLAWPESSRVGAERLAGFWDAMKEAELPIDPHWVIHGKGGIEYGYEAAQELLNLPDKRRPTAIVTLLDTIGIGVIQAAESCGFQVGRDIAVTGFDDLPFAHYFKPGLTTLRQPTWDVGKAVIHLLMDLIKGKAPEEQHILLPPELIIRQSSLSRQPSHNHFDYIEEMSQK